MMFPNKGIFKFIGPLIEEKYNQFFNPNICHVCKSPKGKLIPCEQCHMVFYCDKKHKENHRKSHMKICTAIATTILPEWGVYQYSPENWIIFRKQLIESIRLCISRDLELYEIEMFMCAKSCLICHRQINLNTCNFCYSANFCDEHETSFHTAHEPDCVALYILLNLSIASIKTYFCDLYPNFLKFTQFPSMKPWYNMLVFINEYVALTAPTHEEMCLWIQEYFMYSDYVSSPLTLFYALYVINTLHIPSNEFTIHVIAASEIDVKGLRAWKLLLHIFNKIKKLYIVMIKPEIYFESGECHNLCRLCSEQCRKLYIENVSESYQDYMKLKSYKPPNIIIGQVDFSVNGLLSKNLTTICTQNCPLVFTATTYEELQDCINEMEEIVGTTRKYMSLVNVYRSCRPYRDYNTGGIFYRNAHFVVYE